MCVSVFVFVYAFVCKCICVHASAPLHVGLRERARVCVRLSVLTREYLCVRERIRE